MGCIVADRLCDCSLACLIFAAGQGVVILGCLNHVCLNQVVLSESLPGFVALF